MLDKSSCQYSGFIYDPSEVLDCTDYVCELNQMTSLSFSVAFIAIDPLAAEAAQTLLYAMPSPILPSSSTVNNLCATYTALHQSFNEIICLFNNVTSAILISGNVADTVVRLKSAYMSHLPQVVYGNVTFPFLQDPVYAVKINESALSEVDAGGHGNIWYQLRTDVYSFKLTTTKDDSYGSPGLCLLYTNITSISIVSHGNKANSIYGVWTSQDDNKHSTMNWEMINIETPGQYINQVGNNAQSYQFDSMVVIQPAGVDGHHLGVCIQCG